jgi:hypothetical protein
MSRNLYEPERLLARAKEWRIEAAAATSPERRIFCLEEATRCETVVRQSLETPALTEDSPSETSPRAPALRRSVRYRF